MTAPILEVADAVVGELNAQTFTLPFTATRVYIPEEDLTQYDQLAVNVIAENAAESTIAIKKFKINVLVQQKIDPLDLAQVDPLVNLVDEIATFLQGLRPSGAPGSALVLSNPDPLYDHDQLNENRLFKSIVVLDCTAPTETLVTLRRTTFPYSPTAGIPDLATTSSAFVRDVGSFISDGFLVNDKIEARGFANVGNNGIFTVASVAALTLTVVEILNTEASADQRTIWRVKDYTARSSPPIELTSRELGIGTNETAVERAHFTIIIAAADIEVVPDIKTDTILISGATFRVIIVVYDAVTDAFTLTCRK